MKHDVISDLPSAARVLDIEADDVPPFVRQCVSDRSLSGLIRELNQEVLFGTADQRRRAQEALRHMGFM